MKGASGNIGARGLHGAAVVLEKAIKSGDKTSLSSTMKAFEHEISTILSGREALARTGADTVHSGEAPMNSSLVKALLGKLRERLQASRFDAVDVFRELEMLGAGHSFPVAFSYRWQISVRE